MDTEGDEAGEIELARDEADEYEAETGAGTEDGETAGTAAERLEAAVPAVEQLGWALYAGRPRTRGAENGGRERGAGIAGAEGTDSGGTLVGVRSAAVYGGAAAAGGRSAAGYGGTDRAEERAAGVDGGRDGGAAGMVDALRMGGAGAGALYAGLARSRAAAGYVRREMVAITVPETAERTAGGVQMGVQELDRQFQRDARRYDGGFDLF